MAIKIEIKEYAENVVIAYLYLLWDVPTLCWFSLANESLPLHFQPLLCFWHHQYVRIGKLQIGMVGNGPVHKGQQRITFNLVAEVAIFRSESPNTILRVGETRNGCNTCLFSILIAFLVKMKKKKPYSSGPFRQSIHISLLQVAII